MDRSGDHAFAGPVFTGDQDARSCIGNAVDDVENFQHSVVVAQDVFQATSAVELFPQFLVFERNVSLRHRPLDCQAEFVIDQRFGQQVKCPCFDGFHRSVWGGVARHDQNGRVGVPTACVLDQFESVVRPQAEIANQQIEFCLFQGALAPVRQSAIWTRCPISRSQSAID